MAASNLKKEIPWMSSEIQLDQRPTPLTTTGPRFPSLPSAGQLGWPAPAASEWRAPARSRPRKPKAQSSHCQGLALLPEAPLEPPPPSPGAGAAVGAGGCPALTGAEALGMLPSSPPSSLRRRHHPRQGRSALLSTGRCPRSPPGAGVGKGPSCPHIQTQRLCQVCPGHAASGG